MSNTKLQDILIHGDNFKLTSVDLNSKKINIRFKEVRKSQEISIERKKLDWEKIRTFRISI